jgi:hypothetical protein
MSSNESAAPTKLTFHSDPGHGWLAVPREVVRSLGIESQISEFSYLDDTHVYLEEDLDARLFDEVARNRKMTFDLECRDSDSDSFIRELERFSLESFGERELP